jgi:hypothetical protein
VPSLSRRASSFFSAYADGMAVIDQAAALSCSH